MAAHTESSNTNTVLLILILVGLVGFGAWFVLSDRNAVTQDDQNTTGRITVDVPFGADSNEDGATTN